MEQCQKFLRIISINVDKRGVQAELKDVVVESLVRFLDICRITTAAVKEKRLSKFALKYLLLPFSPLCRGLVPAALLRQKW
jgi:hypothetical protein